MIIQENVNTLRLQCEILLMDGEKKQALDVYERILALSSDPFVYIAKAKLLEALYEESKALESFQKALDLIGTDQKDRMQLIRSILEIDKSESGVLRMLSQSLASEAQNLIAQDKTVLNVDSEKTEIVSRRTYDAASAQKIASQFSDSVINPISPKDLPTENQKKDDSTNYFGRYQILKKLGEGGMGVVYKACDMDMGRIVAIKVIGGKGNISLQYAQRFLKEVKATAKLSHPNIIAIYDFGESPQHYFTMEYVEGKTLSHRIQEGIFPPKKAAKVLQTICDAIECAHKSKIIHRDLKPSNIMMDDAGGLKVMDFGLAKFMESESKISRTGDILGTPNYMPPEQAMGGQVDERSDVYSLGAVGYEMITGRPVFQGENLFNILHQVASNDPIRPQSINANVDIEMATMILKCLEKSPEKRYQSVTEWKEDLTRYLENRPILAKAPTNLVRMLKWTKRNKEIAAAMALTILTIIGIFVYVYAQWQKQIKHIKALNIIHEVMQWDKNQVEYNDEVKPQFEKAEFLSQASIVYQKWGLFCFQYAQAQIHKAQKEKGTICYKDLVKRDLYYSEAMKQFEKAFQGTCGKDYISLYYMLFMLYAQQNNEKAYGYEDMLSKLVKKLDTESGLKSQTLAVEALNKSHFLFGEQKKALQEEARQGYQRAICYDPELPCSHNGLGIVYLERKEYELAQKHLDRCLELVPTYRYAYVNRGRMYLQRGLERLAQKDTKAASDDFHKARHDFEITIELDPQGDVYYKQVTCSDVYYELSRVYSLLQEKEKSLLNLENAIRHGFRKENKIKEDSAFDFIKNTEAFQKLLQSIE